MLEIPDQRRVTRSLGWGSRNPTKSVFSFSPFQKEVLTEKHEKDQYASNSYIIEDTSLDPDALEWIIIFNFN